MIPQGKLQGRGGGVLLGRSHTANCRAERGGGRMAADHVADQVMQHAAAGLAVASPPLPHTQKPSHYPTLPTPTCIVMRCALLLLASLSARWP